MCMSNIGKIKIVELYILGEIGEVGLPGLKGLPGDSGLCKYYRKINENSLKQYSTLSFRWS